MLLEAARHVHPALMQVARTRPAQRLVRGNEHTAQRPLRPCGHGPYAQVVGIVELDEPVAIDEILVRSEDLAVLQQMAAIAVDRSYQRVFVAVDVGRARAQPMLRIDVQLEGALAQRHPIGGVQLDAVLCEALAQHRVGQIEPAALRARARYIHLVVAKGPRDQRRLTRPAVVHGVDAAVRAEAVRLARRVTTGTVGAGATGVGIARDSRSLCDTGALSAVPADRRAGSKRKKHPCHFGSSSKRRPRPRATSWRASASAPTTRPTAS
jgi:hypothetical protein